MTVKIFVFVVYLFEMLACVAYFSRIYEKKFKSVWTVILIGAAIFLPGAVLFNIFGTLLVNALYYFVATTALAALCYKTSFKNAVAQSIIICILMSATEMLCVYSNALAMNMKTVDYLKDANLFGVYAVECKLLFFASLQLLAFLFKKKNNYAEFKQFSVLFIFPVLMIISSLIVFNIALSEGILMDSHLVEIGTINILNVLASLLAFVYYQKVIKRQERLNELETEKMYYDLNNTYFQLLQHQNEELQMIFHDTKHHYLAISSFDNIEDVRKYIDKIYPNIESNNKLNISNNRILDLILNKYIVLCKKGGIQFDYEVKTANLDYIDDDQLSIILNNLLDNAVEAASKSKEKIVELSIRHINDMDLLSVVNSCDVSPKSSGKQLLTSKQNALKHGFGTKIVKRNAKQNNGNFEWNYDEKEKRFHSTILFQPVK